MYLTKSSLGPYYRLHDFKATDALDTKKLSSLKVAGILKYKVVTLLSSCIYAVSVNDFRRKSYKYCSDM